MTEPTASPDVDVSAIKDKALAVDPLSLAAADAEQETLNKKNVVESQIKTEDQDREERLKYGDRAFYLVVSWLIAVGVVVVLHGFKVCGFSLSDPVLVTLVGSTTVSVIGIFLIVANYLFPRTPREK